MLAVILKILSVTGIVLLCILGLILVLAILVLVLPIRYSLKASKESEAELNAVFRLTYFFRIIRALAEYESKKVNVTVKVLWFKIFSLELPEESDDEEISDEEFDSLLEEEFSGDEEISGESAETLEEPAAEDDPEPVEDAGDPETKTLSGDDESHPDTESESDPEENGQMDCESESESGSEDSDDTVDAGEASEDASDDGSKGLSGIYDKLKCKYEAFYDKIKKVRSEYRYYRNILNSNEAAYALRVIKKRLKKVLKLILPRKVKCDLVYGFSSPDITGKVYGLYTLIARRFAKGSRVIPDFDKAVFEGYAEAKGHFNIIGILINGVCILLDKNCRKIYKSLKHHRNKNENEADPRNEETDTGKAA